MTRRDGIAARVPALMIAVFVLVFVGPAAIQFYIRNCVPQEWPALKVTSLLAMLYLSFALWRFLIVPAQHLLTDKWAFALGALGYVVMPVALLVTSNYAALLVASALWGWSGAGLWQTGPVWLYDNTGEKRRGLWAGLLYMAVFAALYAGVRILGAAADAGNRRTLLLVATVPGIAAFALAAALPKRDAKASRLSPKEVIAMLLDRRVAVIGMLLFISATAYGLTLGAFRDRIEDAYGPAAVGRIVGYSLIVRMFVSVAGGHFGDIFARRAVVAAVFLVAAAALGTAAAVDAPWALGLASACLGLVGATAPISAMAYSAEWFEPDKRTLALAASFLWQDTAMFLSLLAGQYIVQATGGVEAAFGGFAALFAASTLLAFLLPGKAHEAEAAG